MQGPILVDCLRSSDQSSFLLVKQDCHWAHQPNSSCLNEERVRGKLKMLNWATFCSCWKWEQEEGSSPPKNIVKCTGMLGLPSLRCSGILTKHSRSKKLKRKALSSLFLSHLLQLWFNSKLHIKVIYISLIHSCHLGLAPLYPHAWTIAVATFMAFLLPFLLSFKLFSCQWPYHYYYFLMPTTVTPHPD